jgi:hypothetical protein
MLRMAEHTGPGNEAAPLTKRLAKQKLLTRSFTSHEIQLPRKMSRTGGSDNFGGPGNVEGCRHITTFSYYRYLS